VEEGKEKIKRVTPLLFREAWFAGCVFVRDIQSGIIETDDGMRPVYCTYMSNLDDHIQCA
jgi:hypothetical protein